MRIVAGSWRGRRLQVPAGTVTRPTSDRARQSVFDMLAHAPWARRADGRPLLDGAWVMDCFAGTGALGLEALSRGAAQAWFVEQDRSALAILRRNIQLCGAEALATVLAQDAASLQQGLKQGKPCHLAFLDPPYEQGLLAPALAALRRGGWIGTDTVLVMEMARGEELPGMQPALHVLADAGHGAARMVIAVPEA